MAEDTPHLDFSSMHTLLQQNMESVLQVQGVDNNSSDMACVSCQAGAIQTRLGLRVWLAVPALTDVSHPDKVSP